VSATTLRGMRQAGVGPQALVAQAEALLKRLAGGS